MAAQIDKALITQFSDMVHTEAQQLKSRFRDAVQVKTVSGDIFAYDGIGSIEASEVVGRVQPTVFQEIEHKRRKLKRRRFVITLPIDDMDVRGALLDPQSNYARGVVMGLERQVDRLVAEAAFADVQTGRDFDTTVTFANDGGLTVTATAGLTYEKLLAIKQNFIDNDVGTDLNERTILAITGEENTALMGETELTSGDYTRQFAVEKGQIAHALGMEIITFAGGAASPVLDVTSSVRSCIAMSTRGICLGISKDISLKIEPRPDYVDTVQVQVTMIMDAVRTEGALVQKVTTTDA